ncbi:MAG: hypothetical protein R3324_18115, partial [Halobacteriales archaeon]|nr:hypothetical protein [Halobacteriales archaeon]
MHRGVLILLLAGAVTASCVPEPEDLAGSVPYLEAPAPVTTTSALVGPGRATGETEDVGVVDGSCAPPGFVEFDGPPGGLFELIDVDVLGDGRLVVASRPGVALFLASSGWEMLDPTGLPEGTPEVGWWSRMIESVGVGADGSLWAAGSSLSSVDDVAFGGTVNEELCARVLEWVARWDCVGGDCAWTAVTANEQEGLVGGVGDLAVAADGTLFASVGKDRLVVHDGSTWVSHRVPGVSMRTWPWSGSLAVGFDGTLFAGTNDDAPGVEGVLSFDGEEFVRLTPPSRGEQGSDLVRQVVVGSDGALWAATNRVDGIAGTGP